MEYRIAGIGTKNGSGFLLIGTTTGKEDFYGTHT